MECQQKTGKLWMKMKSHRYLYVATFIGLSLFSSCTTKYCDLMAESIDVLCTDAMEECEISFKESFDFEWDTLFIFDSMLYPEDISKTLGSKYDGEIVP